MRYNLNHLMAITEETFINSQNAGGRKSTLHKKYIQLNQSSKKYLVKKDNKNNKKYITKDSKNVFLNTIKGQYKYVQ